VRKLLVTSVGLLLITGSASPSQSQPAATIRTESAVRAADSGRWIAGVAFGFDVQQAPASRSDVTVPMGQVPVGQKVFFWITPPSGMDAGRAVVWRRAPPRPWCLAAIVRQLRRDGAKVGFDWIAYEDNFIEWEVRPQGTTAEFQFPQCY